MPGTKTTTASTAPTFGLEQQILKALPDDPETLQAMDEYLIELHTAYQRFSPGEWWDEEKQTAYFYHFHRLRNLLKLAKQREELRLKS